MNINDSNYDNKETNFAFVTLLLKCKCNVPTHTIPFDTNESKCLAGRWPARGHWSEQQKSLKNVLLASFLKSQNYKPHRPNIFHPRQG